MSTDLARLDSKTLLEGLTVVEFSHAVAGAYCGKILAELGASVVRCGPPTDATVSASSLEAMQKALHGAKTCLALSGPALDRALAIADLVIVENGGIDPEFHARCVAVSGGAGRRSDSHLVAISAGVDARGDIPGCGLTSAAWSAMSWAVGEAGRAPLTLPADVPDYVAGVNAAAAALAGLLSDDARPISIAGRDVLAYYVGMLAPNHIAYGRPWTRAGRRTSMSGGMYPCGLFPCADGFVVMYCRRDSEWKAMLAAMGQPAWGEDARFADPRLIATQYADEADAYLLPWLLQYSRSELVALGIEFGFAVGAVKLVSEIFTDAQFSFRGSFAKLPGHDGEASQLLIPAAPWRLYELPTREPHPARAWPVPAERASGPTEILRGIRVLDLSWVWSGPMVTSILSDLGAEVIKIEHPSHLDSVRLRGRPPSGGKPATGPATEVNPWFNQLNHGKSSVIVDIKSAQGQADIRELARSCDVVVENMRPGVLDALSLGYADLAKVNPSIVMLSMSIVGASGPLSQMKGYAGIMSAMAGLESLVGYPTDDGAGEITGMMMTAFGDPNAAMHAIGVLLAALHRRRRSGRGAWIDLAQTDAILSIMTSAIVEQQVQNRYALLGNVHPLHAPQGHYRCAGADRWVAISVHDDAQWQTLADIVGLAGLRDLGMPERRARQREIDRAITGWTRGNDRDDVVRRLIGAGILAAPIANFQEMRDSAWMRDRDFVWTVRHPFIGAVEVFMPPWRFGDATAGKALPAPLLGANSEEVRRRFGLHAAEL